MHKTLRLRWPQTDSASQVSRYAKALEARLLELGVTSIDAELADASATVAITPIELVQGEFVQERSTPPLPPVSAVDAVLDGLGSALACRPDPAVLTVLAFSDGLDAGEPSLLAATHAELAALSPYPLRFVVFTPSADAARHARQALTAARAPAVAPDWRTLDDPELARLLLAADAALVSAPLAAAVPQQDLLIAAGIGIPTLVRLASDTHNDTQAPAGGLGLAVAGATPRQLAGLLLLLVVDPGVRRKVLDAQEAMRQSQQPAAQRLAVADWLLAQGLSLPQQAGEGAAPQAGDVFVAATAAWRVEGVFDSSYSLAIVNRQLALALQDEGETVALYSYEQGEDPRPAWHALAAPAPLQAMWALGQVARHPAVSLRNAWPPVVRDMRARRRVLASYAWEETVFPPAFAEEINLTLDLITVVSRQTAGFLRDAGVHTPVAVVGNGVDHLLELQPEPLPRALPAAGFRFLHVSSCFPRKGVDVLLKAYGEAFRTSDDVVLVIKTFPNPHNDVAAQLERCRRNNPRYPRVELIDDDWTPAQLARLYQSCHALVAPSRGEGFGLPIAEAMLYRLPVIVTAWGGHMDYCRDDNCWLLDYSPQLAQTHLSQPDSLWAEPDVAHLASLMKTLSALPPAALEAKTARARTQVLARYTWRQVAARTRAALRALDARPGLAPPLRIGWMSTWGSRCGIAAYSQHLVAAFSADELHIFAPFGEDTELDDLPNVRRNWALEAASLERLIADARQLALAALVVQFHWGFFPVGALLALLREMRAAGIRVIIDFHNTRSAPPAASSAAVVEALAGAERLLVHTVDDMQRLKTLGLATNVTLFPLAVYPIAQPAAGSVDAARDRLGLRDREVVASYGFLLPHKGLLQLIDAMPALLAARPRLHLLMVNALYSPQRSGAERQRLVERIDELGLGDRVTLVTDFLPEQACLTLLKTANLIVFPYQATEESSSAAVRMALVAHCPTAVTPLPIFADVAAAVSVLPGTDSASLANGIACLLADFDDAAVRAAACARAADFVAARGASQLSRRLRGLILGSCNHIALEQGPAC